MGKHREQVYSKAVFLFSPPQMAMRTWVDVSVKLASAVSVGGKLLKLVLFYAQCWIHVTIFRWGKRDREKKKSVKCLFEKVFVFQLHIISLFPLIFCHEWPCENPTNWSRGVPPMNLPELITEGLQIKKAYLPFQHYPFKLKNKLLSAQKNLYAFIGVSGIQLLWGYMIKEKEIENSKAFWSVLMMT